MIGISCCAYSYRKALQSGAMTLPQFLATCRDIGFDGVELTAYYFPTTERPFLNELKLLAHRYGLAVSGTAVGTNFARAEQEQVRRDVQTTCEWILHSVVLGAPTLRVFAGGVPEGRSEEEAFAQVVACLKECARVAYDSGVLLALENHGGLTATAEGTLRLLDAVDSPAVGLNLDFGNFAGDIYEQFTRCVPRTVACHAKVKTQGSGPDARERVDYRRVQTILEQAGYRGFLAIEYEEPEPAETAVPAFARELFALTNRPRS